MDKAAKFTSKGAIRTRAHRHRRRHGLLVVPVEIHDLDVTTLVDLGYLDRELWADRAAIGRAIKVYLDQKFWDDDVPLIRCGKATSP